MKKGMNELHVTMLRRGSGNVVSRLGAMGL
jgi:hypothetical protein